MQFAPLQFAQPTTSLASQMSSLGKNLAGANKTIQGLNAPPAAAPTDASVGMPGSQFAGPVAPGAGAAMGAQGTGTPGNAFAGPVNPNMGAQPQLPTPQNPYPNGPTGQLGTGIGNIAQNMSPPQLMQWLKSMMNQGQGPAGPGALPGSSAINNAGMLPSTFGG
jgi:hypothetical protein